MHARGVVGARRGPEGGAGKPAATASETRRRRVAGGFPGLRLPSRVREHSGGSDQLLRLWTDGASRSREGK